MQKKTLPTLMMIGSALIFGTVGIFRRNLSLSSALLAFFRGAVGAAVLLLFSFPRKQRPFRGLDRKSVLLLALSGVLLGVNWMLLFEAYEHTTVPTATLCYYMQPTIVILLSPLLFGEKLTPKKLLCAGAALLGMALVSGVFFGRTSASGNLKGVLLGLCAAFVYAAIVILNKKIPGENAFGRTIIQLVFAAIAMLPGLLFGGQFTGLTLEGNALLLLLLLGVVHTGLAYILYFAAVKKLPAQSAAILSYIDPVSALLFAAVFLRERLTVWGLFGAVLIIGAAIVSETGEKGA